MKLASIWNPKGGQGKSMVSINLAAAAVEIGLKPIVIDRDEQGTSMLYHQAGNLPFEVLTDYPQSAPDVDLVLVDHMANDRDIPRPPLLVMPVIPKRSQYAAYVEALRHAEDADKRIITVVINGDLRREQERNVVLALRQRGAFEVRASGIFSRADNEYRTIFDPALNGAYAVRDRRNEFFAILAAVLQNQPGKGSKPCRSVAMNPPGLMEKPNAPPSFTRAARE